jgi:pre-mRNA-splicing factor SYF1
VSRHPRDVRSVPVEAVLRAGISRYTDQVGRLWCALAEHFVRLGEFEKARDVYEEAVSTLATVRDFATVFDAYVQFEEALLTARLELKPDAAVARDGDGDVKDVSLAGSVMSASDLDDLSVLHIDEIDDVELRIARLELLMDRRPVLLSSVMLRQNPHNVHEWHNRAKIFRASGLPAKVIATYAEAVRTVDPAKAVGRLPSLWGAFARFYEEHGEVENARAVFKQASEASFRTPDDLASVRCEWAEMELRHKDFEAARRLMLETTSAPRRVGGTAESISVGDIAREKMHLNARAWGLYLDLEESLGTIDSVKAAYARAFSLKVATPAMALSFARYCEEKGYFEESFRAYELGVQLFPWPHVREIWHAYLQKFVARYGGSKLERARDLFEQAVAGAPASDAASLYGAYADLEERFGLVRHAMSIYDRATRAVDDASRFDTFLTYIRKAEEYFGAPRTREIYARAIESLPDAQVVDMCLRFADLETKLGELDRARSLFIHAANFSDPKKAVAFWSRWQTWETTHGNEESFLDHLRLKRSLATQFTTAFSGVVDMLEAAGYDENGKKTGEKRPRAE